MMRPLSLYLAEFRPDGAAALPAPAFGAFPLLPDMSAEADLAFPSLDAGEFAVPSAFEAEAFPALGFDEAEPMPDVACDREPGPDMAAALAAQAVEHAEALAAARVQWVAEEGAVLADRIGAAFAAVEARLADALAPLLEPFLAKAAQAKALAQLHDMLATLLNAGDTRPVAVSGPADLVGALRDAYGDRPGISFADADAPDVTVALGDTRIRSQLRAWTRKLDAALGAQA